MGSHAMVHTTLSQRNIIASKSTYPNAGLATGAKAAAEATVAMRQKAVFIVKSIIVIIGRNQRWSSYENLGN
jgi:hypothetical protein